MYQPSLYSSYSAVIRATDSSWYVAGNVAVDNSFNSYGSVHELDNEGSVLMEAQIQVPGYETTGFNALATTNTGILLAAGVASQGCDYGSFETILAALSNSGTVLWEHRYSMEPATAIAVNDSLIALLGYSNLLITDLNGDSLHTSDLGSGLFNRVKTNSNGFLCVGYQGVLQVLPDGTSTDVLAGVHGLDILQLSNGQQVLLTQDSILLLAPTLERTGIGAVHSSSYPGWLDLEGSGIRITDQNSTYLFDSSLNLIDSHWLGLPAGFHTRDTEVSAGQLVSVGDFNSGAVGAAVRSRPLNGVVPPLEMDIALSGLTVDSMQLFYSPLPNGVMIQGPIWMHGWVKNLGDLSVDHLTLDQVLPYGICNPAGFNYPYESLNIAPGDSLYMAMGPFQVYTGETDDPNAPTYRSICIWAACPDDRLDRNVADNEGCVEILIPLAVDEQQTAVGLKVHPNPAIDHVTVEMPAAIDPSMTWQLTDLMGRRVEVHMEVMTYRTLRLEMGGLARGTFLISVSNGTTKWNQLIMHQ